ncbi:hypothetical protein D3C72_1946470 [compost metagenome]
MAEHQPFQLEVGAAAPIGVVEEREADRDALRHVGGDVVAGASDDLVVVSIDGHERRSACKQLREIGFELFPLVPVRCRVPCPDVGMTCSGIQTLQIV